MNRAILVAQREFLENIRTKTFWLGILSFPIIILIAFGAGALLQKAKQTKVYAVLDYSGEGLGDAIENKARDRDLNTTLDQVFAELPRTVEALEQQFAAAEGQLEEGDPRLELLALMREIPPQDLVDWYGKVAESKDKPQQAPPPPASLVNAVMPWLLGQMQKDPKKLTRLVQDLSTPGRFRRVPLADLSELGADPEAQQLALNAKLDSGELFAYFVIPENPLGTPEAVGKPEDPLAGFLYVSNNLTDDDLSQWYSRAATTVLRDRRIAAAELAPETASWVQQSVRFVDKQVGATGETTEVKKEEKANKFAPIGFVYLLWIAVFTAAQMLLTNTVEEKSNRIIEVLLSSVSPLQLMSGKIWGIAATGLTIVGSWVVFAFAAVKLAPVLLPSLENFALGDVIGDPLYLASFIGYFLGGYLLYAAMLVAIGSVCNSLKEAQNLMQPVFIVLIVPLVAMVPIAQEPNGTIAKVMTYIPFFTPFTMMNRAGGPPPAWEYALTFVIIVASVVIAFWAAGKIFRIGVLMTGKPPRIKEIFGWLRTPAGTVPVKQETTTPS